MTLFEMLTGRRPFQGKDMREIGLNALTQPTPRVREVNPALPAGIEAIVARAMAPNPQERYGSAAELADALRCAQDLLPTSHQLVEPLRRRTPRRSTRRYAWSAVAVAMGVAVALFAQGILQQARRFSPSVAAKDSTVVAVLPLVNTTGDAASESLGAGFADILISTLAQIPGVTMVSREATLAHRERKHEIASIARELGADLVIDGAVQTSRETVRVTLSLLRPGSNRVAWSRSYDGDIDGILTLQNEVAAAVSQALRVTLTPEEFRRLQRPPPTRDVAALAEYAQARSFLERHDVRGNLERSITLFESAIAKDPRFARAHAGLGEASWELFVRTRDSAWSEKALLATAGSLRLDPEDASAHRALAVQYAGRGRSGEAMEELRRAIALEPENDDAHRLLGEMLLDQGRREDGLAELKLAIALRPNYWRHHQTLGLESFRDGRYPEAAAAFRRVTELQPDNPWGFSGLGWVHYATGNTKQAIENYERAIALGGDPSAHTNLGVVLYAEGRYAEAARAFEEAARLSPLDPSKHRNLGDAYERTGQRERARRAYERAVQLCREKLRTNPRDARTLAQLAVYEAKLGSRADAARHADEAVALNPQTPDVIYRKAVVLALAGRAEGSLVALERAFDRGYSRQVARDDDDLKILRGRAEFEKLIGPPIAVQKKEGTQ